MSDIDEELAAASAQGSGTHNDERLDDALADSFPASDPPACVVRCAAIDRLSDAAFRKLKRR